MHNPGSGIPVREKSERWTSYQEPMKSLPMKNSSDPHRDSIVATFGHSSTVLSGSLILLAVIPYLNTLLHGFVYDDTMQILENPTNSETQAAVRRLQSQTPAAKP